MIIGIPKEIKPCEHRVSVTPEGVKLLISHRHKVLIEKSAGEGSGFSDEEYRCAGAEILDTAEQIYSNAQFIVKVKTPQPSEYKYLRKDQLLITYLHLAVEKALTIELLNKKVTSIAYETVQKDDESLPLLIPASEIAGKMSIHIASTLLEKRNNGSGILLSGVAGVPAGKVLIIGCGNVGMNAAKTAIGIGADVSMADINTDKLRKADNYFGSRVKTYLVSESILKTLVKEADVIIGAVFVPGHKSPKLITEEMVKSMKKGSVILDVSIDQGGIAETEDRITTHENPTYEKYGIIHYCVENMPSSVARTATIALTNESIKYILKIADLGIIDAVKNYQTLAKGINTYNGKLTNKGVAQALNLEYTELPSIIGF